MLSIIVKDPWIANDTLENRQFRDENSRFYARKHKAFMKNSGMRMHDYDNKKENEGKLQHLESS